MTVATSQRKLKETGPPALTACQIEQMQLVDYMKLWRENLAPIWIAHVTRQGIRDHVGMGAHTEGVGEYRNGLKAILGDGGYIRPPLWTQGVFTGLRDVEEYEVGILNFLHQRGILNEPSINGAKEALEDLLRNNWGAGTFWGDTNAVHFSTLAVLDRYYGSEVGNEVFFILPSQLALANNRSFFMNGGWSSLLAPHSDASRNDLFIWPNLAIEDNGININQGIVFLPSNARVDPLTGSRYETTVDEKSGVVVVRSNGAFSDFIIQATITSSKKALSSEARSSKMPDAYPNEVRSFIEKLGHKISDHDLLTLCQMCFSEAYYLLQLNVPEEDIASNINRIIYHHYFVFDFQLAQASISSQEYWEGQFNSGKISKPARVVYYDGDPTEAVKSFLKEHGISEDYASLDPLLGLGLNFINSEEEMKEAQKLLQGERRFRATSRRLIEITNPHLKEKRGSP